jgi:hypothetical protein
MAHIFKTWSETSPTAKGKLAPSFELRGWDELTKADKTKILKHLAALEWFVTNRDIKIIIGNVDRLNYNYKVQTYGKKLFDIGGAKSDGYGGYTKDSQSAAADDFFRIIKEESTDVAFELLSYYAEGLIEDYLLKGEPTDDKINEAYERFDRFSNAVNSIFGQFGINISLTRQGFAPKQEQIVHELVVEPTFKGLSAPKWKAVQNNFSDAIDEYRKGTEAAYSNAITHIVSAVQAFLQIKVRGKIGKGDISELIKEGMKKSVLPSDALSRKVLDGLESTLMEYRQKQGDAHPKAEYANEQSVRLLLNVASVFIQHCNT